MKNIRPVWLILLLPIIIAVIFLFSRFQLNQHDEHTDYPPLIFVNQSYYKSSGASFDTLPGSSVYLGDVSSSVPGYELPDEAFQANDDIVGAPINQAQNQLYVLINEKWHTYLEVSED